MKATDVKQVGDTFNDAFRNAARGVKQLRHSAEDAVEETRHTIKARPLTAVLRAVVAGLAAGVVLGWFLGRRSGWMTSLQVPPK
jgi:predicted NodU family carbamoyl transferase